MRYLLLFLLFLSSVFSEQSAAIISMENDPSTIVAGKVNVITGDLVAFEEDLVIQGVEPIRINRSYLGSPKCSGIESYWMLFGKTAEMEHDSDTCIVREKNGASIWYKKGAQIRETTGISYRYVPLNLGMGFSNTSHGEISSRTNLRNNYLSVDSKFNFFTVYCASGTVRHYKKEFHAAEFQLLEEKLPNGNWILYEYQKHGKKKQPTYFLSSIRTTNPDKNKIYARADFMFSGPIECIDRLIVKGSDGQTVAYQYQKNPTKYNSNSLVKITSSQKPDQGFDYTSYKDQYIKYKWSISPYRQLRLNSFILPLNKRLEVDYYKTEKDCVYGQTIEMVDSYPGGHDFYADLRRSRVKTLSSPIGFSNQITHSFIYDLKNNKTSIFDVAGYRTDYIWWNDFRIRTVICYSKDGKLDSTENFQWGYGLNIGNLISKTFRDSNNTAITSKYYAYDSRGNVLEEKLYGNFSGRGSAIGFNTNDLPISGEYTSKKFKYTTAEPNLLQERQEDSGLRVTFDYLKGTDLLLSEFTYDQDHLKMRKFWEYNKDNILIREIVDDGSSDEKQNLTGVLSRTIRDFTLLEEGPYLGMPSLIEEKYWENGQEHLLKKIALFYTTGGKIEHQDVYDATNKFRYRLSFSYDEKGRIKSQTNALGQIATSLYDECGNQIEAKDYSGRVKTEMVYDLSNRPLCCRKFGNDDIFKSTTFFYDNKHHVIKESSQAGIDTLYAYDSCGRRKEIHFPDIESTLYEQRDSCGHLVLQIDGEGNATKTSYNSYGKPILILYPDGAKDEYLYNLDGSLKTHVDPLGIVTAYEYDYLGRVLAKMIAGERQESYQYHGSHLLSKIDAEGNKTIYAYDGAGRKVAEEFALTKTTYQYDPLGRLNVMQKGALCTITEYDLLDRVIEERKESSTGALFQKITYEYDDAGNKKTITRFVAGGEAKEELTYDSLNRLTQKRDPLGAIELFIYQENFKNARNQCVLQKTHIDPMGLKSIQTYDTRGKLSILEKRKENTLFLEEKSYNKNGQITHQTNTIFAPDAPKRTMDTLWKYDSRGRLKTLIEPEGKITNYQYTLRGELAQTTKPNGTILFYSYNDLGLNTSLTSSDGTVHHQMAYNRLGQLVSTDQIHRILDPHGRLLKETFPHGYQIENQYDHLGRRTQCLIQAADCLVRYAYDEANVKEISRYSLNEKHLYTHTYGPRDLSGNLLQEESISGTTTYYSLDLLSRKTAIEAPNFNQKILEFDPVGNIRSMSIHTDTIHYTYDDLYQLTSEKGHTYSYDSLNNRLQKDSEIIQINSQNQDITHFAYDKNGNPISQGIFKYSYDALDRIIAIETPSITQFYTYDSLNRCISKSSGQKMHYFLYDGQNEIGSFDQNLNPIELRVLGPTPRAEIGAAIAIEVKGIIYDPTHDLQGNVAVLSSPFYDYPIYYRYTAFGEETIYGPSPNPWRYSSKRTDDETGLVYFGRRFYSPAYGRWLTPDPAGFSDGMNLYAYVHNDPLTHFDEYGLITYHYRKGWINTPFNSPCSWDYPLYRVCPPVFPAGQDPRMLFAIDPYRNGTPHYYVNGILNSNSDNKSGARALLATYGNKGNIIPFHSESFGALKDLHSVYKSKSDLNYTSFAIRRLNRELQVHNIRLTALDDPRKVFITCFSRGATDVYHAVKDMTAQQKDRLMITACGPIKILPRNLGFRVNNLVSEGDWCSFACNPGLKENPRAYKINADVDILPQKDGFTGLTRDHFFKSQTYQTEIKDSHVDTYRTYGEYH